MADKYTLTPQMMGIVNTEPTLFTKIYDFVKGKRRFPEGRNVGEDSYDFKESGEIGDLISTYLRQKEDTMDERNKFANTSERFQTKTDYDRRRIAYAEKRYEEDFSNASDTLKNAMYYKKDNYIRQYLDEFDILSLDKGERMAQGGIVSLNQMTRPIGYR